MLRCSDAGPVLGAPDDARSGLRDETWIPRHGVINVTILPLLALSGSDWEATVKLRDTVRGEILRAGGAPDLAQ